MFAKKLLTFPTEPIIHPQRPLPLEYFIQHFSVLCLGLIMATLISSMDILYRSNNTSSGVVTTYQDKGINTEDDKNTIAVDDKHGYSTVEQNTQEDQYKDKGIITKDNKEEYINQSDYENSEQIEKDKFYSMWES